MPTTGHAAQNIPAPDSADAERRPKKRNRELMPAVIAYDGGYHIINCSIRDLSESGARIGVAKGTKFPARFYLVNIKDRMAYEAEVVWSGGSETGLVFSKSFLLTKITDPELSYLRRIWVERAGR